MTSVDERTAASCSNDSRRQSSSHVWLHDLKPYPLYRTLSPWKKREKLQENLAAQARHICTVFPPQQHSGHPAYSSAASFSWYSWWAHQKLSSLPDELLSVLTDHAAKTDDTIHLHLLKLWEETAAVMRSSVDASIDFLISHLVDVGVLKPIKGSEDQTTARNLLFTIIGWQTMLYMPERGTCPSTELAITDEMDGYRGQGKIIYRQDQSACKRPLYQFLMGFGVLLPPCSFHPGGFCDDQESSENTKTIQPTSFNASLLESIGGLTFKWVDSLSLHLELDQNLKILYLYRYPSFCAGHLTVQQAGEQNKGAIHGFGAPHAKSNLCASIDDISKILQETLRSYRLLFGQSKQSRSLFRSMNPFGNAAAQAQDTILAELCGRKRCKLDFCEDRDAYDLARHFPMYESKIVALNQFMSRQGARTWKQLWQDKRNSAQWFTFWAVLLFGGLGVMIGLLQVILQIVQIVRQTPI